MTFFAKLVPAPLLSAALFATWLALARTTSPEQILLGLLLALAVPMVTTSLRLTNVRVRRPLVVLRFILRVGGDVVISNFQVAWGVLTWRRRPARSKFVVVPLELRAPIGLAALAMVTTVVPGTVWSELKPDRSAFVLHVWDVHDEAAFVARFKARYEAPLREIFE